MNPKKFFILSTIASIVLVGGLLWVLFTTNDHPLLDVGGDDGKLGGDFTLTSVNGDVSLSDYEGQLVLMYFGFLNCPKVCPSSMGVLQRTFYGLDDQESEQVKGLLVSIDPKRDSADDLAAFTKKYHANITGLTGSPEAIDRIARDYGAYFEITTSDDPNNDYVFEHSSRYYLINHEGELVDAMRHSTTSNELLARIRQILATKEETKNNDDLV
jgi:protein SCO1/2